MVVGQRRPGLTVDAAHQVADLGPVVLQLLGLPLRLGRDLSVEPDMNRALGSELE